MTILSGQVRLTAVAHAGRAPVRGLHVADVEVVVGKHRAADRADEDGAILQAQFFDRFGDQLVRDAVAAARAVVRLLLAVPPLRSKVS